MSAIGHLAGKPGGMQYKVRINALVQKDFRLLAAAGGS